MTSLEGQVKRRCINNDKVDVSDFDPLTVPKLMSKMRERPKSLDTELTIEDILNENVRTRYTVSSTEQCRDREDHHKTDISNSEVKEADDQQDGCQTFRVGRFTMRCTHVNKDEPAIRSEDSECYVSRRFRIRRFSTSNVGEKIKFIDRKREAHTLVL